MKRCPTCQRTYTDVSLNFCLEDGTPLLSDAAPGPPPAEIHHQPTPLLNQVDQMAQPRQWSPTPMLPQKKSNAIWWILAGILVVGIVVVGAAVMILALASLNSNSNTNADGNENLPNANSRTTNRNSNSNTNGATVSNANSAGSLPASLTDDFSEAKDHAQAMALTSLCSRKFRLNR